MWFHITSYLIMKHHITCHHIISCHVISYHIISYALVDPFDIARRDQIEFFIEKISDHRGKLSHRKSLRIFVRWMGYDRSYDSWEPFANLCDSDHLHSYLREKNLTQLIPSKFRQVNHPPERNLAPFEDFLPLSLSLMVSDGFSEVSSQ